MNIKFSNPAVFATLVGLLLFPTGCLQMIGWDDGIGSVEKYRKCIPKNDNWHDLAAVSKLSFEFSKNGGYEIFERKQGKMVKIGAGKWTVKMSGYDVEEKEEFEIAFKSTDKRGSKGHKYDGLKGEILACNNLRVRNRSVGFINIIHN